MKNSAMIVLVFLLVVTACGYGREDDEREKRREDLQELSEEMNNNLTTLSSLKIQLRDSLSALSAQEDSLAELKVDKYRLLLAELEKAEVAYENWKEQVELQPQNMNHEEAMHYYDEEEENAEGLRQDINQAIEYVESELREEEL